MILHRYIHPAIPPVVLLVVFQLFGCIRVGAFEIDPAELSRRPNPAFRLQCTGLDDTQALKETVAAAKGGPLIIAKGQTCGASEITLPNLTIEEGGLLKPFTGHA